MATSVACPLCLHSSFSFINDLISALLNFLKHPLVCPLCGHVVEDISALKNHLSQHLLPQDKIATSVKEEEHFQYNCKQCANCQTNDLAILRLHVETEHPEKKFLCVHCCKLFKVQASLTLHLRMAHQTGRSFDRQHQCQSCGKRFASLARKQAHEKVHQLDSPSPVKSPSNESNLTSNESEESKQSVFVCSVCDKTFKKEQYLQQHSRTHEAKKWECSVCKKLFTTKEYLRKHARLHTGETPYTCDQCGKTFTFQQSYHKHLLYHSDERPYSCDQCNRRFKELSTLHNHQRIHTGEKPYSCDTCGKSFRQRVSYVVHRRIHTGALPYVCLTCGKSFRYKVSQRTHKCDADRTRENGDIVRHRPDWLERLVTAQQQLTTNQTPETMQVNVPVAPTGDTMMMDDSNPSDDGLRHLFNDRPTQHLDSKSYYENDSLPFIDLSQLTLSLDSDLIFPS